MQNLINENFENWEMVVSADCEGSFEYTISENGKIATICLWIQNISGLMRHCMLSTWRNHSRRCNQQCKLKASRKRNHSSWYGEQRACSGNSNERTIRQVWRDIRWRWKCNSCTQRRLQTNKCMIKGHPKMPFYIKL